MAKASVLVAGGAGFVGSAVVRQLCEMGHRVAVLDNYLHGSPSNLQDIHSCITIKECDAAEHEHLADFFRSWAPEYVVSCVGDTFVPAAYSQPQRFFRNNVTANLLLLDEARRLGVKKFVYLSSTEVYGDAGGNVLHEQSPFDPVSTYAVSKLATDRLCFSFWLEHALPVVIARLFNCYGPRETHAYIVPEIISQLSKGQTIALGNLEACRDLTFVEDTARAVILLLFSKDTHGKAFNVGSNVSVPISQIVEIVAAEFGRSNVKIEVDHRRLRKRDIQSFRCDYSALEAATGWTPRVSLVSGLQETIDWFCSNGSEWPWKTFAQELDQC